MPQVFLYRYLSFHFISYAQFNLLKNNNVSFVLIIKKIYKLNLIKQKTKQKQLKAS